MCSAGSFSAFLCSFCHLNTDHQSSVVDLGGNSRGFSVCCFRNAEIPIDISSEDLGSLLAKLSTFDISSHFSSPSSKGDRSFLFADLLLMFLQHCSQRIPGNDSLDLCGSVLFWMTQCIKRNGHCS